MSKIWKLNSKFASQYRKKFEMNKLFVSQCRKYWGLNYNFLCQCRKTYEMSNNFVSQCHKFESSITILSHSVIDFMRCITVLSHSAEIYWELNYVFETQCQKFMRWKAISSRSGKNFECQKQFFLTASKIFEVNNIFLTFLRVEIWKLIYNFVSMSKKKWGEWHFCLTVPNISSVELRVCLTVSKNFWGEQ